MRLRMLATVMHNAHGTSLPCERDRIVEVDAAIAAGWIARGLAIEVDRSTPLTRGTLAWGCVSVEHDAMESSCGWPFSGGAPVPPDDRTLAEVFGGRPAAIHTPALGSTLSQWRRVR